MMPPQSPTQRRRTNKGLIGGAALAAITLLLALCAPAAVIAQTQLNVCLAQGCTASDDTTDCDERWQSAIGGIEATQSSIEVQASKLFSLSEGDLDSSRFIDRGVSIEQDVSSLEERTDSTLTALDLNVLRDRTMAAELSNVDISATTSNQQSIAEVIGDALDSTAADLSILRGVLDVTTTAVEDARAFLCPADVPHADDYHFSGSLDSPSSYGTFQLEMGAEATDIVISFTTPDDNTDGGILLRHASLDGLGGHGIVIGLTSDAVYASVQCASSSVFVSVPFMANSSVLHTVAFTRTGSGVVLRVDGENDFGILTTCDWNPSGQVFVGTPQALRATSSTGSQGSFEGCIRTISVDGVIIVQEDQASSATLDYRECRSTLSDYVLLIDVSNSLSSPDRAALRRFVDDIATQLLKAYDLNVRVALALFSGRDSFQLVTEFTYEYDEILGGFDAAFMGFGGQTYIGEALRETAAYFSMNSNADNKVLYVISDGNTADPDLPDVGVGAMALASLDVVTIAFGAGTGLNRDTLLDVADQVQPNVVIVGAFSNFDDVDRDFPADSCDPKLPMLALFEQSGISDCERMDCADYVAHSSQLPTVETFIVADNARLKELLLQEALDARNRLREIASEVSASASVASNYNENTFVRISSWLASSGYQDYVATLSTGVEDYRANVTSLSVLVSSLHSTASSEVSTVSLANSIASETLNRLSTSVSALTSTNSFASETQTKVESIETQASLALLLAQDKLRRADSLNARVEVVDDELSALYQTLSTEVSNTRSSVVRVTSSVMALQLPVDVPSFSSETSVLVSNLEYKVDVREETTVDALRIVSTHDVQEGSVTSLAVELDEEELRYGELIVDLSSIEAGLSVSVREEASTLRPALSLQNALTSSLSVAAEADMSREVSAGARTSQLMAYLGDIEDDVDSVEAALDATSDVVSEAISCYDATSTALENLEAVRSSVRIQLTSVHSALSSVVSNYNAAGARIDALESNEAEDSASVSSQISVAASLASRYTRDNDRAVSLSNTVASISDECFV